LQSYGDDENSDVPKKFMELADNEVVLSKVDVNALFDWG